MLFSRTYAVGRRAVLERLSLGNGNIRVPYIICGGVELYEIPTATKFLAGAHYG